MRRRPTTNRSGTASVLVTFAVVVFMLVAAIGFSYFLVFPTEQANTEYPEPRSTETTNSRATTKKFSVVIRKPDGPPRVFTGLNDVHGNSVTVACGTCHATREPSPANRFASDLDEFHGSVAISHGELSCLACHNPNDYDALKLADGSRVEFTDVMALCAQCHSPQMQDFEHGVHGGMTGHWDLNRGPQTKNNCVDCHQPHSPQFPKMFPDFKPHDRFLDRVGH